MKVEYENGKTETWATNNTWKLSFDGPIRSDNEYDGEEYDARREQALKGWTRLVSTIASGRKPSAVPFLTVR